MATNVPKLVNELIDTYLTNGFTDVKSINNGSCEDFAEELAERINAICIPCWEGYAEAKWEYEYDNRLDSIHCFVEFNGMFYDSETPQGVHNFLELPIYSRISPFLD